MLSTIYCGLVYYLFQHIVWVLKFATAPRQFLAANPPCFALGLGEEHQWQCRLLALRPEEATPSDVTTTGFNFGHSEVGTGAFAVIHFVFEFYGFRTYHVLLNPNNPFVQAVMATMIAGGDYFFFAFNVKSGVTAFRAEIEYEVLSGHCQLLRRLARWLSVMT